MITQPKTSRLIEVVQRELMSSIAPLLTDPSAIANVHMIHQILGTIGIRAEHEIAWLIEEIGQLEALGQQVVDAMPTATTVASALAASRAAASPSLHLDDVCARYSVASEILSCCAEAVPEDCPLNAAVQQVLDARLANEATVIGDFTLVGRT
ncbi:MAG: hypothetical protein Q7V57_07440 [Actinomycetota bacterium]|nr:hypothetical protein [Actinomycetota bacterium]